MLWWIKRNWTRFNHLNVNIFHSLTKFNLGNDFKIYDFLWIIILYCPVLMIKHFTAQIKIRYFVRQFGVQIFFFILIFRHSLNTTEFVQSNKNEHRIFRENMRKYFEVYFCLWNKWDKIASLYSFDCTSMYSH